jgi:two-component system NtrC family sensor kinase
LGAPSPRAPLRTSPGMALDLRKRVLLLDDDPLVAAALARGLGPEFETTVMTDGLAVIERLLEGERYDGIVAGMRLGWLTGIDVYHVVRSLDPEQARRMIFITGALVDQECVDFAQVTGRLVLEKPVDAQVLLQALRSSTAA